MLCCSYYFTTLKERASTLATLIIIIIIPLLSMQLPEPCTTQLVDLLECCITPEVQGMSLSNSWTDCFLCASFSQSLHAEHGHTVALRLL